MIDSAIAMYIIKNKNCWEKSWKEPVTRPIPINSSPNLSNGALPEALDDSEKRAGLVLGWVDTQDESLAPAEELASSNLALGALESESDLLGLLGLLSEDGLGLATEARLLGSISASALSLFGVLALLVLSNLEFSVTLANFAVSVLCLGSVHLYQQNQEVRVKLEWVHAWNHASPGKRPC